MLRVGLTGGIASGKSRVSALLAAHGAVVIDADLLAREVVAPGTPGLADVVERFGRGVLSTDGSLDRVALGRLIFDDPVSRRALEALIHPRVRARAAEIEAAAPADAVVVHDIPLLVETGQADRFDLVVVVDAPVALQVRRLRETRDMSEQEAGRRISAQIGRAERLAVADHVLANSGSEQELADAVDELWSRLSRQPEP